MSSTHSRNASEESNSSSMSFILEHVLQYPGSYEIPLRTMHELNRKALLLPTERSRSQTPPGTPGNASPVAGKHGWSTAETATMNFTSQLMEQVKGLPTRPSSLPPTFIVNFVSRCFHPTLGSVDFGQALTALDYLNSLETRRRKETLTAFERLHIRKESYDSDMAFMAEKFPGIALWVGNVEGKNKKAEQYFAQIYLGLRRWIMINLLSETFVKLDCLSMLNTLFPPMHDETKLPSHLLSRQAMKEERDLFFRLIREVQLHGREVLRPHINLNKGPDDTDGWTSVQRVVAKYLRVAENMIKDCIATTGPDSFATYTDERSKDKKHDSGVSFGSQRKSSVGSSRHENQAQEPFANFAPPPKGFSKLERITREFRRMRVKPRTEVDEMIYVNQRDGTDYVPPTSENVGKKSLKKARSLASLKFGNGSSLSLAGRNCSEAVPFDANQMKKHRMMYDASVKQH